LPYQGLEFSGSAKPHPYLAMIENKEPEVSVIVRSQKFQ
jgi:hypothetical protein